MKITVEFKIRKFVSVGGEVPRFYGVAYYDPTMSRGVCYPLGMNMIVGLVRKAYIKIRVPFGLLDVVNDAYQTGFHKGYWEGYRVGYEIDGDN